jgi:signal transduction histidine kinase/ActR/RegA family two-component response regulator
MYTWLSLHALGRVRCVTRREETAVSARPGWRTLPLAARIYVAVVIIAGAASVIAFFPRMYPQPVLFAVLLVSACLTSSWKVNLPITLTNGSTLSVSYAANLMSLLLLGPQHAVVIAAVGAWMQCNYKAKHLDPLHRSVFSTASAVITMAATGLVYGWMGGPVSPSVFSQLPKPLVGAVATYFLVNTSLVAGAIALSSQRTFRSTWGQDFLWSGSSFMVAGSAGAAAAVIVARGEHWTAMLLVAPIYLTYRTYQLFVGRLADEKRHKEEIQHLLEREQTARASAEDANRLKDQFLAVVSHELRTPLNAILGWADMLRRGTLAEPQRERALRTIHNSAKRQAQLIEDLLDVARITTGKLRLERALVDLREVVRDALQIVQPGADVKRIRIAVDTDPAVVPLYGDAARLQQIVSNLLSNAVKFTTPGGTVQVRLKREGNLLELAVADSGQGISPAFLPWVFEPFRQADGSTTRVHSGLGLGLSIVKNLVEAHGGTVAAESGGEGCGATFTVRLPISLRSELHPALAGEQVAPSIDGAPAAESLEGVSVLVVDDDASSREVAAAHLQGCRAAVLTASSAAHAFEVMQRQHVDVLIADIGMPEEDGYSLIRRLRAFNAPELASIPAAALTAFAREEDRQRALQAGFQLHLAKPIDARELVDAVANLRGSKVAIA